MIVIILWLAHSLWVNDIFLTHSDKLAMAYCKLPTVGKHKMLSQIEICTELPCLTLVHFSVYQNVQVWVGNIIKCLKI